MLRFGHYIPVAMPAADFAGLIYIVTASPEAECKTNPFKVRTPNIAENSRLREPQQGAYAALSAFAANPGAEEREVGIVLPVGCGKSGCITLTPFAFKATRTLVIAPNVPIAVQLEKDFDPANPDNFYLKCTVLDGPPYPEVVDIRGTTTNRSDLRRSRGRHHEHRSAPRWRCEPLAPGPARLTSST